MTGGRYGEDRKKTMAIDREELIRQLRTATAGHRELDMDIFQLLGGAEWKDACSRASQPCGAPQNLIELTARKYAPFYTRSIDEACATVAPSRMMRLTEIRFGMWLVELWRGDKSMKTMPDATAIHTVPAMALCIAGLLSWPDPDPSLKEGEAT